MSEETYGYQSTCPKCGSKQASSEWNNAFECGTMADSRGGDHYTTTCHYFSEFRKPIDTEIERLKSELAQANEYARKLSIKVNDQGNEILRWKHTVEQYRAALGRILSEVPRADGLTWFYPIFDNHGDQIGRRPANLNEAISGIHNTAAHVLQKCKGGRDYRDGGLKGVAPALEGVGL